MHFDNKREEVGIEEIVHIMTMYFVQKFRNHNIIFFSHCIFFPSVQQENGEG